jgi:acetoin utilization protein AcuB
MIMAKKTLVQDIMTRDPLTVTPDTSLFDAFELMSENEIRRLPIVTNELVGIVTLSDILGTIPSLLAEADVETKLLLSARKVRSVMSWGPAVANPETTIQDAAERMLEEQVSGLPVISGGSVVGIITESDIFRLVVESWSEQ